MPGYTRESGNTLDVVGVCVNRIGMVDTLWKGRYLQMRLFRICSSASERLSSSMLRTSVSKVPCLIDVSFSLACWTVLHDRDLVRQD